MKNFITITTILAAGTLCANAATNVINLSTLATDSSNDDLSYSASTGYVSKTSTSSLTYGAFDWASTSRLATTIVVNIDLTALGITESSSTWRGSNTLLLNCLKQKGQNDTTIETANSIGLLITENSLMLSVASGTSSETISWSSLLDASYRVNNRDYVTLAIQANVKNASSNSNGTAVFIGGSGSASINSTTSGGYYYSTVYLNKDYITGASIYTGVATSAQISSSVKLLTIPEPSMFGLFAGTLALGLAGTRRRRGNAK